MLTRAEMGYEGNQDPKDNAPLESRQNKYCQAIRTIFVHTLRHNALSMTSTFHAVLTIVTDLYSPVSEAGSP